MPRRVTVMPAARRDLGAIRQWLLQPGSGRIAHRRLATIEAAVFDLADYPCRWSVGAPPGTRERYIERHVLIYRVTPDTGDSRTAGDAVVLRVFGPGQSRDRL